MLNSQVLLWNWKDKEFIYFSLEGLIMNELMVKQHY